MKTFAVLVVSFAVQAPCALAQQTYTAIEEPVPEVGWKFVESGDLNRYDKSKVVAGGKALQEKNETVAIQYEVEIEVLEVAKDDWSKAAIRVVAAMMGGQDLGLAGKTVIGSGMKGERTFSLEGGELTAEQAAFFKEVLNEEKKDDAKPTLDAVFLGGGEAHAVGSSWDIPIERLVKTFDFSVTDIDLGRSSGRSTLQSVDESGDVPLGAYEFEAKVAVKSLNGTLPVEDGWLVVSGTGLWPLEQPEDPCPMALSIRFEMTGRAKDLPVDQQGNKGELIIAGGAEMSAQLRPVE